MLPACSTNPSLPICLGKSGTYSAPIKPWSVPSLVEQNERLAYYGDMPASGKLPQRIKGRWGQWIDVPPHMWGITLAQCREFMALVQNDEGQPWSPECNVIDLVVNYIKPWTAKTGVGYSLLVNQDEPKEVNVMVSHSWAENAAEFFDSLSRSVSEDDVMYICFLANYQHDDGYGPTLTQQLGEHAMESPFRCVLDNILEHGQKAGITWKLRGWICLLPKIFLWITLAFICMPMVFRGCVPKFDGCVVLASSAGFIYDWVPEDVPSIYNVCVPGALVSLAATLISCIAVNNLSNNYHGRLLVVPNYEGHLYSRLWCVYEMFCAMVLGVPVELAATMASPVDGNCSSQKAKCSQPADEERIKKEISENKKGGFKRVDTAITKTRHRNSLTMYFTLLDKAFTFGLLIGALAGLRDQRMAKRLIGKTGMHWAVAILEGSGALVDGGYTLGNILACFVVQGSLVLHFIKWQGRIQIRRLVPTWCFLAIASVFTVSLGLGLAAAFESAEATDQPGVIFLLTFLLGFSRPCFIMTVGIPPFIMLAHTYVKSSMSRRGRALFMPMVIIQTLAFVVAIPCARQSEDYYPTVVLFSLYVGCLSVCLAWLPVFKQLGMKFIWYKQSDQRVDRRRAPPATPKRANFADKSGKPPRMARAVKKRPCSQHGMLALVSQDIEHAEKDVEPCQTFGIISKDSPTHDTEENHPENKHSHAANDLTATSGQELAHCDGSHSSGGTKYRSRPIPIDMEGSLIVTSTPSEPSSKQGNSAAPSSSRDHPVPELHVKVFIQSPTDADNFKDHRRCPSAGSTKAARTQPIRTKMASESRLADATCHPMRCACEYEYERFASQQRRQVESNRCFFISSESERYVHDGSRVYHGDRDGSVFFTANSSATPHNSTKMDAHYNQHLVALPRWPSSPEWSDHYHHRLGYENVRHCRFCRYRYGHVPREFYFEFHPNFVVDWHQDLVHAPSMKEVRGFQDSCRRNAPRAEDVSRANQDMRGHVQEWQPESYRTLYVEEECYVEEEFVSCENPQYVGEELLPCANPHSACHQHSPIDID